MNVLYKPKEGRVKNHNFSSNAFEGRQIFHLYIRWAKICIQIVWKEVGVNDTKKIAKIEQKPASLRI